MRPFPSGRGLLGGYVACNWSGRSTGGAANKEAAGERRYAAPADLSRIEVVTMWTDRDM